MQLFSLAGTYLAAKRCDTSYETIELEQWLFFRDRPIVYNKDIGDNSDFRILLKLAAADVKACDNYG